MKKRNFLTLVKEEPKVAQNAINAMVGIIAHEGLERLTDPFWRNWLLQVGAISAEYHSELVQEIER